jgi:hypothetical protein
VSVVTEALAIEIKRVLDIFELYIRSNGGDFGGELVKVKLKKAIDTIAKGDHNEMMSAYHDLKDVK